MLKIFIPNLYVTDIQQINIDLLKENGIKGILTDLDNTLVRWDQADNTTEIIEWIQKINDNDINTVVISNNSKLRVKNFIGDMDTPYIYKAKKPLSKGFKEALNILQLPANEVAVIGDQVLTDVLGGNRLGMFTILVDPIGEKEAIKTKFNRMLERQIIKYLNKKGLIKWVR